MDLFIGRLIALVASVFISFASIESILTKELSSAYLEIALAVIFVILSLVILISFFKKHFQGTYNDDWQEAENLKHSDLAGLYPAFKINKVGAEDSIQESFKRFVELDEERVMMKFSGVDHQGIDSILVFTNKRLIYYRTKSFGLNVLYQTVKNLIDKIPFVLWPIEGIEDAFQRLLSSQEKGMRAMMDKATDEQLMAGDIKKWTCRYVHHYESLKTEFRAIEVKNGSMFHAGVSFDLFPIKWSKVFKNNAFEYRYRKHFPEIEALIKLATPLFANQVVAIDLKKNKRVELILNE